MVNRRGFLSSVTGVAGALRLAPRIEALLENAPPQLPASSLYEKDEEAYWTELRKQYLIPEGEVYLNNGTVGSSPRPVLKAVCARDKDKAQAFANTWGYESVETDWKKLLARNAESKSAICG